MATNCIDRKDLGTRIINWDNEKGKNIDNDSTEGSLKEIQGLRG